MSRQRRIRYGIDQETGYTVSHVGDEVAFHVVDYEQIDLTTPGASERPVPAHLEKTELWCVAGMLGSIRWTRKLPAAVKNVHRKFWGLRPLACAPGTGDQS